MNRLTLLVLAVLALACGKVPEVDFGSDESVVSEMSPESIEEAWNVGVDAFRKVVGVDEYCIIRGVFRKFSRDGDAAACKEAFESCKARGKVKLPRETFPDWQYSLLAHCQATVGQMETCFNDGLKVLDSGIPQLSCSTPAHMIDRHLKVPESCRLIEKICITPTLVGYMRGDFEDDE